MESYDQVCHLCLEQDGSSLIALNDEDLTAKIHRIFYFEVTFPPQSDALICRGCKGIIEDFHSYAELVSKNQERLRATLCTKPFKKEYLEESAVGQTADIDYAAFACEGIKEMPLDESVEDNDTKDTPTLIEAETEAMDQNWGFNKNEEEQSICPPESEDERWDQSSLEQESVNNLPSVKEIAQKRNAPHTAANTAKESDANLSTERMVLQRYKLTCDLCSKPLTDFSELSKHYRQQHNVAGYLRCCNKKIVKKCWMIEHLQLHIDPDAFRCVKCAKSYSSSKVLKEHLKEVHASATERSFPCTTCGKAFVSRAHLNAHVMVAHGTVSCPQCDKVLASQGSLRKHLVSVHGEGEKHVCEVCARVFRSKQCFDTHRKTHDGSRQESKVQCDLCQAWLMDKYCLTKHMRRMHNEEDTDPAECGTCGKTLRNQNALSCHMWRAHSESRFECEWCKKQFKRPHHMREHIAIHHTGGDLYGCQYCQERFNTKNKQYAHRKTAHPKEFAEELKRRMLKE